MTNNSTVEVCRDTVRRIPGAGRGNGTATGRRRVTVWQVSGYLKQNATYTNKKE